jgi:hypothetical protein
MELDEKICRLLPVPKGPVCVNAVKLVGVPVGTCPKTHDVGMEFTGAALDNAAVALAKNAYPVREESNDTPVQLVVTAIELDPVAAPFDWRAKVIAPGIAVTVTVSRAVNRGAGLRLFT